MTMAMPISLPPDLNRLHTFGRNHELAFKTRRLDESVNPTFKPQAINHNDIGLGQRFCVGRRWVKYVCIRIRAD